MPLPYCVCVIYVGDVLSGSSEKVLTMEYCPGIKINRVDELDRLGLDRARLARLTVEAYLLQILKFGLFHADPHPGNIAVDPKSSQIIYYDFGMMGNIQVSSRLVGKGSMFCFNVACVSQVARACARMV